GFDVIDTIK
nr:RecName: Full=Cationic peroxidase [Betula pendula]P86006.1 RecName: Full=Peroxidase 7 [Capsicum annuum]